MNLCGDLRRRRLAAHLPVFVELNKGQRCKLQVVPVFGVTGKGIDEIRVGARRRNPESGRVNVVDTIAHVTHVFGDERVHVALQTSTWQRARPLNTQVVAIGTQSACALGVEHAETSKRKAVAPRARFVRGKRVRKATVGVRAAKGATCVKPVVGTRPGFACAASRARGSCGLQSLSNTRWRAWRRRGRRRWIRMRRARAAVRDVCPRFVNCNVGRGNA